MGFAGASRSMKREVERYRKIMDMKLEELDRFKKKL